MQQYRKNLGKVSLTAEGAWDGSKAYDILSMVYDEHTQHGFISRQAVPEGVDLYNKEYWMPLNVSGYADNNVIILSNKTSEATIQSYTLEEAIASIKSVGRRPGAILGFYNENADRLDIGGRWELWQFNDTNIYNWDNVDSWQNLYYNYNKFMGWFRDENFLNKYAPFPEIGCYAFVGSEFNEATVYRCDNKYVWSNTTQHAWDYVKVIVDGNVTVGENGNWFNNGEDTGIPASVKGENGKTPIFREKDNTIQYSFDNVNWITISDKVAAWFRWNATTGDTQANNVGRIQISRDGVTWTNLSGDIINNLHISRYIGADESLPISGIAEGTIYAKGPYYKDDDTNHDYPAYRIWVYAWKGNTLAWQDNGEFTSIAAGVVQETGDSETEVMSQKAVTDKFLELASNQGLWFGNQSRKLSIEKTGFFESIKTIHYKVNNINELVTHYYYISYFSKTDRDIVIGRCDLNYENVERVANLNKEEQLESGIYKLYSLNDINNYIIVDFNKFNASNVGNITPTDGTIINHLFLYPDNNIAYITKFNILQNPPRKDDIQSESGYYKGYSFSLEGLYSKGIRGLLYRGVNHIKTSNIVSGLLLDKEGSVTKYNKDLYQSYNNGWYYLPITKNDVLFKGSFCFSKDGGEVWNLEVVYLLNEIDVFAYTSDERILKYKDVTEFIKREIGRVNYQTGEITNEGYHYKIEVDGQTYDKLEAIIVTNYTGNDRGITGYAFLDADENYISGGYNDVRDYTIIDIPSNAVWFLNTALSDASQTGKCILYQSTSLQYQINELKNKSAQKVEIEVNMPSDIYVINNRTSQFFFRGFIKAVNPYNYDIKVRCGIGKKFDRYYEINPTSIGDYPIEIQVRDDNRNIVGKSSSVIHVIDPLKKEIDSLNILCVGASATATGHWVAELNRMLTSGSNKYEGLRYDVNFVGRKVGSNDKSVHLEATGGWSWRAFIQGRSDGAIRFQITSSIGDFTYGDTVTLNDYIQGSIVYQIAEINLTDGVGNIRCVGSGGADITKLPSSSRGILVKSTGESLNFSSWEQENFTPFVSDGVLNFKQYADKYCNGTIDILITHMGVNDSLWDGINPASAIDAAETFIDGFLNDFPDSKIIVSAIPMPSQDGGINSYANSYSEGNINQYGALSSFMRYNNALYNLINEDKYAGKVYWAATNISLDCDYAYPYKDKEVNTRITTITERVGTNGVHPVKEGSYMVSDGVLPIVVDVINNLPSK